MQGVGAAAPVAWPGAPAIDHGGYASAAGSWSAHADPASPDFTVPSPPTVGAPAIGEAPGSELSRSVAARAASLGGFRIPTGSKASAPVAAPIAGGGDAREAPKRASGGLRLGGGARRADPNALNRIASALDGGEGLEAGGMQPPSPDAAALTAEAPPARRAPLLSSPLGFDDLPPVTVAHMPRGKPEEPLAQPQPASASAAKKPLLSAPLDVDVAPVAPRVSVESKERTEAVRPASAPTTVEPAPRTVSEPRATAPRDDLASEAPPAPARIDPATERHAAPTVPNPAARPIGARPGLRPPGASPTGGLRPPTASASATPSPAAATPNPPGAGDDAKLRAIYQQYIKSRREQNEPVAGITYDKLADSLRSQAQKLKDKHSANRVDYEVVVKDGKTLIKPIVR